MHTHTHTHLHTCCSTGETCYRLCTAVCRLDKENNRLVGLATRLVVVERQGVCHRWEVTLEDLPFSITARAVLQYRVGCRDADKMLIVSACTTCTEESAMDRCSGMELVDLKRSR